MSLKTKDINSQLELNILMIKTSVILCSHNGEKFIKQQVNSILNQTVPVSSIYIHDYNSSDKTPEIIKSLERENSNVFVKLFGYANGPADSFLNSLNIIRTKKFKNHLIYLVDQDDIWLKNKNEVILVKYTNIKFDVAFHDVKIVDDKLSVISESYYQRFWNVKRDFKLPNQLYSNCVIGHTCVFSSKFINIFDIKHYSKIPMHDWCLINEAIFQNKKIEYIDTQLSLYRQHENNILGASSFKKRNPLKRLKITSNKLNSYHKLLLEKHKNIKKFRINSPLTIVKHIRPIEKLIFVLIVKFLFKNDKL